jgi:small-conductance mechanosensitive channel
LKDSIDAQTRIFSQLSFGKIAFAVLLIFAAWLALSWLRRFFAGLGNRHPQVRFLIGRVEPPIRITLWFAVLFACVEVLAPSREAVLAVLASAAVAIGLGLQDLIKNVVGGLVIVLDRPFQTGDLVWVRDAHGEVEKIGLRSTNIRSSDGLLITVPNADLVNSYVFNSNKGAPESLVSTKISLQRGSDYDFAVRIGREIAIACPYTHLGRPVSVEIGEHGPRAELKLTVNAYAYDHRYETAMQTEIYLRVSRALKADDGTFDTGR